MESNDGMDCGNVQNSSQEEKSQVSSTSSAVTYDELFPGLPQTAPAKQPEKTTWKRNTQLRVGFKNDIQEVFHIPHEERKYDSTNKSGDLFKPCPDIMKATGANIEASYTKDQSLTFVVTGKQNAVLAAKREILKRFKKQCSSSIDIPKEYHGFVLGKRGAKLKELEKQTATQISVPEANEPSCRIVVTGLKEGVEKAVREIQKIADDRSKNSYERLEIPKVYHPFITGPYSERLKQIAEGSGVKLNIPPPSVDKDEISMVGEREIVIKLKHALLEIYDELKRKCATASVEIPKKQHTYVIGPRGAGITEILQETGVSVEVPPLDSDEETITLRGPQEKLGIALTKLHEKANSLCSVEITAPSWIHGHIIGKNGSGIRSITKDCPKVHVEMEGKADKVVVEGPVEDVEKVRKALVSTIDDLLKKLEPKHHKQIIDKGESTSKKIREETRIDLPPEGSKRVTMSGPKEEVKTKRGKSNGRNLTECTEKIRGQPELHGVADLQQHVTIDCAIPQKHHRTLVGSKGVRIQTITTEYEVKIKFPDKSTVAEVTKPNGQVTENKVDGHKDCDVIRITGRLEKCEAAKAALMALVPVTVQVPAPFDLHRFIIGPRGKNIYEMMTTFDVNIKVPSAELKSDVIEISGSPSKVESARLALVNRVSELEQQKQDRILKNFTLPVDVPPEYHHKIIGKNGKVINKLRDDYQVSITMPKSDDPDGSVIIKGYEQQAILAKEAILKMVQDLDDLSKLDLRIDRGVHSRLIGQRGRAIRDIMNKFKVEIRFPDGNRDIDLVTVIGPEEKVQECSDYLLNLAEEYLQDMDDEHSAYQYTRSSNQDSPQQNNRSVSGQSGFVVAGAPWEKHQPQAPLATTVPNPASNEEFPSFGDGGSGSSGAAPI